MSLVSAEFLIFILISAGGYYLIPKRGQGIWLLAFSYLYYLSSGVGVVFFLLSGTLTTYVAGCSLEMLERSVGDTEIEKGTKKRKKKRVLILTLVFNFGILGILKYAGFFVENINLIFHTGFSFQTVLLPLGISFYTFQSMGYLLDVYWGKCKAEKNVFRFALFVSFFPQLLQGPIGRYDRLAEQLYRTHSFSMERIGFGAQRILWGYFKKLVLADRAGVVVNQVFQNYTDYMGITVMVAVLCYSIQLYADFSGGIDVVLGTAELFGITLDENFKRPFFAVSITDFWHRWHITLGTWMKDYVFYPLSLSKGMSRFGKWSKKRFGKKTGRVLPICAANIVVFLVVGIWHGAAWKYIVYGLYNGVLIALASLFAPVFRKGFEWTHIDPKSFGWKIVRIIRTFFLVNISWYFDMALSLSAAVTMIKNTVLGFRISALYDGTLLQLGLDRLDYIQLLIGVAVLFAVGILQEKGIRIRERISSYPLLIRWGIWMILLFSLPFFGYITAGKGGFIYAQF